MQLECLSFQQPPQIKTKVLKTSSNLQLFYCVCVSVCVCARARVPVCVQYVSVVYARVYASVYACVNTCRGYRKTLPHDLLPYCLQTESPTEPGNRLSVSPADTLVSTLATQHKITNTWAATLGFLYQCLAVSSSIHICTASTLVCLAISPAHIFLCIQGHHPPDIQIQKSQNLSW